MYPNGNGNEVLPNASALNLNADERQNGYSAYLAMMAVAYALMLMGMNSNKTTDVLAGGMGGFLLSCAAFTLLFAAIAREILKRRDVRA